VGYAAGYSALLRLLASVAQQYSRVFLLPKIHSMADGMMVSEIRCVAAPAHDWGRMEQCQWLQILPVYCSDAALACRLEHLVIQAIAIKLGVDVAVVAI
jgi:hypothetical protein